nr:heat shock protein 20 [Monochamus alternatus]
MSLLSFYEEPLPLPLHPSRILDQHFGLVLDPEDLLQPLTIPTVLFKYPTGYVRNWRSAASDSDTGSTVTVDKEKFLVNLDVQQFQPEEISVKITDNNTITVEGKHEEQEDKHGWISRHFVRKYVLPDNCDINKVKSKLSSDGVLSITAPKKDANKKIKHKSIPIEQTGEPAKKRKIEKQIKDNRKS